MIEIIQKIGNSSQEGYVLIDSAYRIVWINAALERKGFSLESIKGSFYYQTFDNKRVLDPSCSTARAFTSGQIQEKTEQGQDGKKYAITSIPIKDGDNALYVLEIGKELIQDEAQKSNAAPLWERDAIEKSFDGVFVTDKDYRIIYVNEAFEKLAGHGKEKLIGEIPLIFKNRTREPGLYKEFWKTLNEGRIWEVGPNAMKDNANYANELRIIPIRDDLGFIRYYVGIEKDVTQMKKIEQKLLRYQTLADSNISPVIQAAYDGSFTILGGSARSLYSSELPLKNVSEILGKTADQVLSKIKETGREVILPRTFSLKGKSYQISAVDISRIQSINFYFSDVSAMQKTEKRLLERNEELEKFYKLAVGRELKMIELKQKIARLEQNNAIIKENQK